MDLWSMCTSFESFIAFVFNKTLLCLINLICDTRHLCTRIRIDGLKAKWYFREQTRKKFVNTSKQGRVCLFSLNETKI